MPHPTPKRRLWLLVAGELALFLPALGLAWWFGLPLTEQFPKGWSLTTAVFRGVVVTLPLLLLLAWALRTPWRPAVRFRRLVESLIGELMGGAPFGWMIAVSAAAGIGEELLFRGALQPLLIGWFGPWAGIALASLLFGLAHPISRAYFVIAAVIGFYFGVLAFVSGEVVSAIVAHGLYDLVALRTLLRRRQ